MRWGSDDVGVVLTRNEIWLLLHALAEAPTPAVDWEGNRVEPWVIGELQSRLQEALRPEPVSDVEERPIIRFDSDMGRSLAMAGVRPLAIPDGYDLGSLFAACAERGWGAELRLPVGSGPETPAEARVMVGKGQKAKVEGNGGGGSEDVEAEAERAFVGLERPVVAMARAVIGAAEGSGIERGDGETGGRKDEELSADGAADPGEWGADDEPPKLHRRAREVEEYVVPSAAVNPGEREALVAQMAEQGWELVGEDGRGIVFRRGSGH